ncbi:6-phosphogluconolactonase [Leeia sp. TBRC 13508]|uniref:6-phosphogluconolactonase n=1 Tax=Leeia speluncae TaxID=2884804 RepID=A0ABS8DAW1_9NEIS|nr:6-phosphogluconolactonase [Leeia speluncae]MCB6185292.1 6-phosphogluconolactonase [Leeia speluncae]
MKLHVFNQISEQSSAIAKAIAQQLSATLANQDSAVIAVSGGKSPVPVFEQLREMELPWDRVIVTLVDERWVPESDSGSNAALVRTHLLQGQAASATFIPMFGSEASASDAESRLNATFTHLGLPFSVVVLGMGDDGHTASLFPASPALDAGLANDAPICLAQVGAVAPTDRMSLTLPAINQAGKVFLQFAGSAKKAVFDKACEAPSKTWPVSFVLCDTAADVEVFYAE